MRTVTLLLLVVAGFVAAACEDSARRSGIDGISADSLSAGLPPLAEYVNVYLIETDPEPGVAADTGIGCGDRLVPVAVPAKSSGLEDAMSELLTQPDTMGLMNALYQGGRLGLDSVVVSGMTSRVYIGGPMQIGGVCDHPRIVEQLIATARSAASTDSVAFYVDGEPLDSFLSLR